ncbi:uncharacterized protein A1O9_00081 [Exophiala aquamarina CBS 119918]|uniref:CENP-V/GFA domain-containing protein n=1 Tax=Exophiala aquamarina CBS 119918 TaxID=1182545 RepID=A0A072PPR5_9EURO|nr:uncharacterized protein A1O9_00081 [Exophiala aquamarina CBS 119918]KEF62109.1 hypothetical protein A1O9_00081 [Exophiala aquamarina CBS 119918]
MSQLRPIHGACNCGRNLYSITVPEGAVERAEVYFDDSSESRRSQATPLTAWLRVPLPWFASATQAHFPDETHSSIRKIFTPLHTPHCQRVFCGYCGTHLSYWTEQPASEAEYLSVTLGSLLTEDLRALQELDLLPGDIDSEALEWHPSQQQRRDTSSSSAVPTHRPQEPQEESAAVTQGQRNGKTGGLSWFEELLEGSRLGRRHKTRRGHGIGADGSTIVEWEVSEDFDDGTQLHDPGQPASDSTSSKRKIDDVTQGERGDDVTMNG